MEKFVF